MSSGSFEILDKDGAGRLGRLTLGEKTVRTPALLPVVHPRRKTVPVDLLQRLDVEAIICNAYSILRSETLHDDALDQGLPTLLDYDGVIMTDSGTFQAHVYGDVDVTNEQILRFQARIGTHVATILDIFSEPDHTEDQARDGAQTTYKRARDAVQLYQELADDRPVPHLALPVQGGIHPQIRQQAGQQMDTLDGTIYPIGGVVPLMEQQRYHTLARVIAHAKRGLGVHRPVHLFGGGHPAVLPLATLLGCDLYDSASYAKYARDGRYIVPWGTLHLDDLLERGELPCACPVCAERSPTQLRDAARDTDPDDPDPLAEHNLRILLQEIRRVRTAIRQGQLFELTLQRARDHPRLLDALPILHEDRDRLLALDPATKPSALHYTGPETHDRPEIHRLHRRLDGRWRPWIEPVPLAVEIPWTPALATGRDGPYLDPDRGLTPDTLRTLTARGILLVYATPLGPIPWTLAAHYPAGQSVHPIHTTPTETEERVHRTRTLLDALARKRRIWDDPDTAKTLLDDAPTLTDDPHPLAPHWTGQSLADLPPRDAADLLRLAHTATHQLGPGAAQALLGPDPDRITLQRSRRTGRIRTLHVQDHHVASLRAEDGHLTLKIAGAQRLHQHLDPPALRLPVTQDSAPYNRDGRSVFCGFVRTDDPTFDRGLAAREECLVTDPDDQLVACAQTRLAAAEIARFGQGIAATVRDGVPE